MVGVMRGSELCEEFQSVSGQQALTSTGMHQTKPGDIDLVSPSIGDIHKVSNDSDQVAVSIHVYGANIGAVRRSVYDRASGQPHPFISGYSSATIPNIWDRSLETGLPPSF
jgi:predicted metal-dependent enzyme (double-stranded beta helix superfamily)